MNVSEGPSEDGELVDLRGAQGVQVGDSNTQIIYSYSRLTWDHDLAPAPMVAVSGRVDSPYRGLAAFTERDAPFFFGREVATSQVMNRLAVAARGSGILVVSGASGAGKSSLLRAGVLPRLRGAGLPELPASSAWPCLLLTPSHNPLNELAVRVATMSGVDATVLRRNLNDDPSGFALATRQAVGALEEPGGEGSGRLLLIIDQFEQLFTQCPTEHERRRVIAALAAAASGGPTAPAAVVIGIRADFEARCAEYRELAEAVQDRYLVTGMNLSELESAITQPARQAGTRVEPDLVTVLLREGDPAGKRPGALPLLSHALDRAWRVRGGDTLTLTDYERVSGIEGAVAASANEAFGRLSPAQQEVAHQLFLGLTSTTAEGVITADRADREELLAGRSDIGVDDLDVVLECFAAERLLTISANAIEISHEVLLSAWPLLRDTWLGEEQAERIVRTRLRGAARDWERSGHDPAYLYAGSLLDAALASLETAAAGRDPHGQPTSNRIERRFLQASKRSRDSGRRRVRGALATLAALVVALAGTVALTVRSEQAVVAQRDQAAAGRLVAESENADGADPAVSDLESLAAWRLAPSAESRYAMLASVVRPSVAILRGHTSYVNAVAFSPDGRLLASAGVDPSLRLWDADKYTPVATSVRSGGSVVRGLAFSPDGRTIAGVSKDGLLRLWGLGERLKEQAVFKPRIGALVALSWSPNGRTLIVGGENGVAAVSYPSGRLLWRSAEDFVSAGAVVVTHDGKNAIVGSSDGSLRWFNISSGRVAGPTVNTVKQPTVLSRDDGIRSLALSRDGTELAEGGGADGLVRLYDERTRRQMGNPLAGSQQAVNGLAFGSADDFLVAASTDATIRYWNTHTHLSIGSPLSGHAATVNAVAVSPNGRKVASGSADGTVRVWNSPVAFESAVAQVDKHNVASIAFRPDGKVIAVAAGRLDGFGVHVLDPLTLLALRPLIPTESPPLSVGYSRDGRALAVSDNGDAVTVYNAQAYSVRRRIPAPGGSSMVSVALSAAGSLVASGSDDGVARVWNVDTGRLVKSYPSGVGANEETVPVNAIAFSPNGEQLAYTGQLGFVVVRDLVRKGVVVLPAHRTGVTTGVAFTPDGRRLVTSGSDGTVKTWDVLTGHPVGGSLLNGSGAVMSVAVSPDGQLLASGDLQGNIRLWDVATGRPLGLALSGGSNSVRSVAFSPDGNSLVTGDLDGTVRSWTLSDLQDPQSAICRSAGRNLSRSEWTRLVGGGPAYQTLCS